MNAAQDTMAVTRRSLALPASALPFAAGALVGWMGSRAVVAFLWAKQRATCLAWLNGNSKLFGHTISVAVETNRRDAAPPANTFTAESVALEDLSPVTHKACCELWARVFSKPGRTAATVAAGFLESPEDGEVWHVVWTADGPRRVVAAARSFRRTMRFGARRSSGGSKSGGGSGGSGDSSGSSGDGSACRGTVSADLRSGAGGIDGGNGGGNGGGSAGGIGGGCDGGSGDLRTVLALAYVASDPKWRGCGLGARVVKVALQRLGTRRRSRGRRSIGRKLGLLQRFACKRGLLQRFASRPRNQLVACLSSPPPRPPPLRRLFPPLSRPTR